MMDDIELAGLRADLETLLPDTCVIQSLTQIADGQGGFTDSWAAAGTVLCRLDNVSGRKSDFARSMQSFSQWVLTVPQDTTITTANRVVHNEQTYSVAAVSDTGSLLACKRAALERV